MFKKSSDDCVKIYGIAGTTQNTYVLSSKTSKSQPFLIGQGSLALESSIFVRLARGTLVTIRPESTNSTSTLKSLYVNFIKEGGSRVCRFSGLKECLDGGWEEESDLHDFF